MNLPQIPESSSPAQSPQLMIILDKRHATNSEPTEHRNISAEPVVLVTVVASS